MYWALSVFFISVFLTGCETVKETSPSLGLEEKALTEENPDPFEEWNRVIFTFNEGVDTLAFWPIAETYTLFVPPLVQDGISNALANASLPLVAINWALQGRLQKVLETLGRFLINTVFGLGGLFEVIPERANNPTFTNFGETLQSWGAKPGPYIVIPLFGPSTIRDATGIVVDFFLDPINIIFLVRKKKGALRLINWSCFFDKKRHYMKKLLAIQRGSLDFYTSVRSLYLQTTTGKVDETAYDGPLPTEE